MPYYGFSFLIQQSGWNFSNCCGDVCLPMCLSGTKILSLITQPHASQVPSSFSPSTWSFMISRSFNCRAMTHRLTASQSHWPLSFIGHLRQVFARCCASSMDTGSPPAPNHDFLMLLNWARRFTSYDSLAALEAPTSRAKSSDRKWAFATFLKCSHISFRASASCSMG